MKIANAIKDLDVLMEQPCPTYEECLSVRRHTNLPFVLDEVVDSVQMLTRIHSDMAADVVNLKISRLGGLTRTRQVCICLCILYNLHYTVWNEHCLQ